MYRIVSLIINIFLLSACQQVSKRIRLPYYNEANFTPLFIDNNEAIKSTITHQIADFIFLNQDSIFINQKNIEGKIHVANFIFTTCSNICPNMTRNLKTVNDVFSNDSNIVILSYSVTPWIDSPSRLKKYKSDNNIQNHNWHFLTGNKSAIYQLARQSYFAEESIGFSKDSSNFLHTEHCILVDKNKRIRGIYNGTLLFDMEQLVADIKNLKEEI